MLRLNFNYADNALRITTLNDVHTGHEVSPESFARISAKCRRISPDSGGSGGASPSPFSGSSSCASSKSTNPSPRTCFLPSRAHTHSGSEKTSPASQNEAERNALGSLCENDAPASAGRIPLFSGMPLMQTLKEELLRAYLSPAMSYNAVPNIHPQRSFPSQMPHVDQQRKTSISKLSVQDIVFRLVRVQREAIKPQWRSHQSAGWCFAQRTFGSGTGTPRVTATTVERDIDLRQHTRERPHCRPSTGSAVSSKCRSDSVLCITYISELFQKNWRR